MFDTALSDFRGQETTRGLVNLGRAYEAATACNLYSAGTLGPGSWYLPSAGEAGILLARMGTVNNTCVKLGGEEMLLNTEYWTTTEHWEKYCFIINTENGMLVLQWKTESLPARPILAFNPE